MRKEEIYEKVCGLLMNGSVIRSRKCGFASVCRKCGASRKEMDNMFYERFGMSGEEMLENFRRGKVVSL